MIIKANIDITYYFLLGILIYNNWKKQYASKHKWKNKNSVNLQKFSKNIYY